MKFEAITVKSKTLTEGEIYIGNVVIEHELRDGRLSSSVEIVVFNDEAKWRSYPSSYFIPHEDN